MGSSPFTGTNLLKESAEMLRLHLRRLVRTHMQKQYRRFLVLFHQTLLLQCPRVLILKCLKRLQKLCPHTLSLAVSPLLKQPISCFAALHLKRLSTKHIWALILLPIPKTNNLRRASALLLYAAMMQLADIPASKSGF